MAGDKEMVSKEPVGDLGDYHSQTGGKSPVPNTYCPGHRWWTFDIPTTLSLVQLEDASVGVSGADVERRGAELGNNKIPLKGGPSALWIFVRQFLNSITLILTIVVVVSGYFQDWAEFGVVLFLIFFNAILGFYQEYSAERSLQNLKQMTAGSAKVLRDGVVQVIFIDEVVVGDVVILEQGSSVPADCRIIEHSGMEVDEALLTGEAVPVMKHFNEIHDPEGLCALGDRKNLVYRSTTITQGRGKAVVVAAGIHSEMGKLAARLTDSSGTERTALMKKLDLMMYILFGICLLLALVVFAANNFVFQHTTLSYAMAVAVAILPESLVAVITVSMTVSVRNMAKQKCVVRKLAVLEVLGNVTDICSDKTGTLTENKMVVKKVLVGINEEFIVTGAPYERYGTFVRGEQSEHVNMMEEYEKNKLLYEFMRCAALCSTTSLHVDSKDADLLQGSGNPTEVAIQVLAWKADVPRERLENEGLECVAEYPFDSTVKRMSTAWYNSKNGELLFCTKGAPERVLELCDNKMTESGKLISLTAADREELGKKVTDLASQGLRTICFATRPITEKEFPVPEDETFLAVHKRDKIELGLTFLGIVGIYDPPRPESRPSVVACQHAGIVVRMLTGDHAVTAGSIATMLNIISESDRKDPLKVLTGPEFDRVDMDVIEGWDDLPLVVGRCSPDSKVKMIDCLHKRGRTVAMTGDGFNDSPSIKISDVGLCYGIWNGCDKGSSGPYHHR
ncbi:hypothetical protein TRVL_01494 [Trypanosoma vivax]|nr:hypothetical protein TRVL_01494 [Trypanosoma vivax]